MNKKEKDCYYWVVVLLAGVALGVVAGLGLAGFAYPIFQSEKWAAWVQAVGSVLGITVAIYIPYKQRNDAQKMEREKDVMQRLAQMYALLVLSFETLRITRFLCKAIKNKKTISIGIRSEHVKGVLDQTRAVPLEMLPEQFMKFAFDLRSNQVQILELLEQGLGKEQRYSEGFTLMKDRSKKLSSEMRKHYKTYRENWFSVGISRGLWRFGHGDSLR